MAEGEVRVNEAIVTARAFRLGEGDRVEVEWDPTPGVDLMADASVEFAVVYEDEDVIVVDKPAGLVVHPGAGNESGTLVHGLLARYPAVADVGAPERPGIVHRLDRETSGLLMVACAQSSHEGLVEQLAARTVDRRYLALAWGAFDATAGMVDAPIGRSARNPTRMAVSERGREAVTRYEVRQSFSDPVEVSLVDCRLSTGRTHQIRVHLSAIGHAVVGDERYRGARQSFAVPRLFLHAAQLSFTHPKSGARLEFESPLPADLREVLGRLS